MPIQTQRGATGILTTTTVEQQRTIGQEAAERARKKSGIVVLPNGDHINKAALPSFDAAPAAPAPTAPSPTRTYTPAEPANQRDCKFWLKIALLVVLVVVGILLAVTALSMPSPSTSLAILGGFVAGLAIAEIKKSFRQTSDEGMLDAAVYGATDGL